MAGSSHSRRPEPPRSSASSTSSISASSITVDDEDELLPSTVDDEDELLPLTVQDGDSDNHHRSPRQEDDSSASPSLTEILFTPNNSSSNIGEASSASSPSNNNQNPNRNHTNKPQHDTPWFVLARVWQIYITGGQGRQAGLFLGLAAACTLPMTLLLMLIVNQIVHNPALFGSSSSSHHHHHPYSYHNILNDDDHDSDDDDERDISRRHYLMQNFVGIFLILMTQLLLHHAIGIWSDGAICLASAEIAIGRPAAAKRAWRHLLVNWKLAIVLMVTGILSFVFILIGYCFFYVVGLVAVILLYLTVPALVLEPRQTRNPIDALMRSVEMTQGHIGHFLTCHVVLLLIQSITAHIVNAVFLRTTATTATTPSRMGHLFTVWGTWVSMIPNLLFVPAFSILKTVLYLRVRVHQEGLTAHELARDIRVAEHGGDDSDTDNDNHAGAPLLSEGDRHEGSLQNVDNSHHRRELLLSQDYHGQSAGSLQQQVGSCTTCIEPMAGVGSRSTLNIILPSNDDDDDKKNDEEQADGDHDHRRELLRSEDYDRQSAGSLQQQVGDLSSGALVAPMALAGARKREESGELMESVNDDNDIVTSALTRGLLPSMPEEEEGDISMSEQQED